MIHLLYNCVISSIIKWLMHCNISKLNNNIPSHSDHFLDIAEDPQRNSIDLDVINVSNDSVIVEVSAILYPT